MPDTTATFAILASALSDDPREAPRLARQYGFRGVQFDAYGTRLSLPELSQSGRREFRHMVAAQSQLVAGLRAGVGIKGLAPGADIDQVLDRLDKAMETAAGMGAPLLCVDTGPLPEPPPDETTKPRVTQEQAGLLLLPTFAAAPAPETTTLSAVPAKVDPVFVAQVDAALADLGQRADRYGVMVALRTELSSLAALDRAIRRANCPWFGVDLDPVAILRDAWDLDTAFSRLGPLVRHVRVRDALRGTERRTQPTTVGRGNTDWNELASNLDGAGYHGWLTVDPTELADRPAAATAALAVLKAIRS